MFTTEQIRAAESQLDLSGTQLTTDDNVRIAYEWLDAQRVTNTQSGKKFALKYLIGLWSGRKISEDDVRIAASLHEEVKGAFPGYNIHPRLTFPSVERLRLNVEILIEGLEEQHIMEHYRFYEIAKYTQGAENTLIRTFFSEPLPEQKVVGLDFCDLNDCECYYCVYGR